MIRKITIGIIAVMLLLAAAVQAEVVLNQKITVSMMGMKQDMTSVTYITADKSRTETEMQGAMAAMSGGGKQVTITRLDKGVAWMLDDKTKTYNEITMAQMGDMMEGKDEQAGNPMGSETEKYTWTTNIEKMGDSDINGITCKGVKAVATGVGKEDPNDKMKLVLEQWLASDIPNGEAIKKFSAESEEKYGFNPMMQNKAMAKMAGQFGFDMAKLEDAMKDMSGIPVKMSMVAYKTMPDASGTPSEQEMFSFAVEVTSIEQGSAPASGYDVPEGYKAASPTLPPSGVGKMPGKN